MLPGTSEKPSFPLNLLGDFAGGGLLCATGILLALIERGKSGRGQVVNADMVTNPSFTSPHLTPFPHRSRARATSPPSPSLIPTTAPRTSPLHADATASTAARPFTTSTPAPTVNG